MPKCTITLEDGEAGSINAKIEFTPELEKDPTTGNFHPSPAQGLGYDFLQTIAKGGDES